MGDDQLRGKFAAGQLIAADGREATAIAGVPPRPVWVFGSVIALACVTAVAVIVVGPYPAWPYFYFVLAGVFLLSLAGCALYLRFRADFISESLAEAGQLLAYLARPSIESVRGREDSVLSRSQARAEVLVIEAELRATGATMQAVWVGQVLNGLT